MRKPNPKFRWHLTDAEKKEIKERTLRGERQAAIARSMKLSRGTVGKAQRKMGLPTVPPIPEEKIVELSRLGWGGYRIHRELGVPSNRVFEVLHKHGLRNGYDNRRPRGNVREFVEDVMEGEDYVLRLAKKHNLGLCNAYRVAHAVLNVPSLLPGPGEPTTSRYPSQSRIVRDFLKEEE